MKKWMLLGILFCAIALSVAKPRWGNYEEKWENYKKQILSQQRAIPGWCSPEKARKLMDLVHETHPKICVEIGVFGGSSVYPTAKALSFQKEGVIYAIDPWATDECTVGYSSGDPNRVWWSQVDLGKIYDDFLDMIDNSGLSSYCHTMRMTSKEALPHFQDELIDILHIDGNHSEESALADAQMFFPKVKQGGYIWFDDVDWSSTKKAVMYLQERCTLDYDRSIDNSCFLFRKN